MFTRVLVQYKFIEEVYNLHMISECSTSIQLPYQLYYCLEIVHNKMISGSDACPDIIFT